MLNLEAKRAASQMISFVIFKLSVLFIFVSAVCYINCCILGNVCAVNEYFCTKNS